LKFKIDENLPAEYRFILQQAGLHSDTVADENLSGADDEVLIARCGTEQLVLMTLDLDFANVLAYPPNRFPGIVVFRAKSQSKPALIRLLQRVLPLLRLRSPERQLWIVEEDRIRIRE